jgi:hypothetical protein
MKPPAVPFHERYQNPLLAISTAFTSACFIGAGFIIAQDSPAPPRARPRVAVSAPAVVQQVAPPVVESQLQVQPAPQQVAADEQKAATIPPTPHAVDIKSSGKVLTAQQIDQISATMVRAEIKLKQIQKIRDQAVAAGQPTDSYDQYVKNLYGQIEWATNRLATSPSGGNR